MRDIGTGQRVFASPPVRGVWRELSGPDDVLELMDVGASGVVAAVRDAGATFLAPLYADLAAVVCMSGTPRSHIGIVSREYELPCVTAATFPNGEPVDGSRVEVDCSQEDAVIRVDG